MALVVACFAEVASRFDSAGGPYLYARVSFGRLAGIEMAWLSYLVRLTAAATNANLFVIYLAEFWPEPPDPSSRGCWRWCCSLCSRELPGRAGWRLDQHRVRHREAQPLAIL
jgi:amino acid transporter